MPSKMSTTERNNNIEGIQNEILSMRLSRLIVFCDIIDRYLRLRLKEDNDWLRVHTILFLTTREEDLTPSQLAKLLLRSKNSITKLLNSLESTGLIKRIHSSKDHRKVVLKATPKGLEFTRTHLNKLSPLEEELRDCLDGDELSELVHLARKLRLQLIEKLTGIKSYPDIHTFLEGHNHTKL